MKNTQTKTTEYQEEKQVTATEDSGKQLAESKALIKKYDYDTLRDTKSVLKEKE